MAYSFLKGKKQHFFASGFHSYYGAVTTNGTQETSAIDPEVMRKRLKWHYMNAYQKYKAGGRKPWKLLVQIIKILLVTIQICWFSEARFSVVLYLDEVHNVFDGLLLNNQTSFYTKEDFYKQINFTTYQYEHIDDIALGPFARPCEDPAACPVQLCVHSYSNSTISPRQMFYEFSDQIPDVTCMNITTFPNKSISEFVDMNDLPTNFNTIDGITLILHLQTIKINPLKYGNKPECLTFKVKLKFHNVYNTGKFMSTTTTHQSYMDCKLNNVSQNGIEDELLSGEVIFDILVIFLCFWSFVLTARSVYRNFRLAQVTFRFFREQKKIKLSMISDGLELVNAWFIIILLTDILTIVGSFIKIYIDIKNLKETYFYDLCSLCLGISVLLIWIGILRYLGFLQKYNVLLITIEAAMPSVLRFLSCAGILYFGFMFCGWIVIGPYHPKFSTLSEVSECLFSLINGDDMFPTFRNMSQSNYEIWIFSKIYLYVFISLFIYIVLSLVIGIISDSYERLKSGEHILCSNVKKFIHGPECHCFSPTVHSEMAGSSDTMDADILQNSDDP